MFVISPVIVRLALNIFHYSQYPSQDSEIAGPLPVCPPRSKDYFVSFCTESVARNAWANSSLKTAWYWTPSYRPPVYSQLEPTIERYLKYVNTLGLFYGNEIAYVSLNHKCLLGIIPTHARKARTDFHISAE